MSSDTKNPLDSILSTLPFLTSLVGDVVGSAEADLLGLKVVGCNMILSKRGRCILSKKYMLPFLTSSVGVTDGLAEDDLLGLKVVA